MPKTSQNTCQNRDFKKRQRPGVDCLTLQVTSIEEPESELGDSSHRKVPTCHTWVLNMQWNLRVFQDFRPRMQTPSNGQAGKHNDWRAISMGPTCNTLNVNLNRVSNMVYPCLDTSSVSGHPFDKTHMTCFHCADIAPSFPHGRSSKLSRAAWVQTVQRVLVQEIGAQRSLLPSKPLVMG